MQVHNGEVVDVDGDYHETMQIVTNRRNSHYRNILVVNDVVSVIGGLMCNTNQDNYCKVQN